MKRLLLVLSLAAIMAAVMAVSALAAFAAPNANASSQAETVSGFKERSGGTTSLGEAVKPQAQHNQTDLGGRVSAQPNRGRG